MKNFSAFDIIGPRMIGPSSSHTAGAARLAKVARRIAGKDIREAVFVLYGSFMRTYKGHGTDKALVAGILGMNPDDERLRDSFALAEQRGLKYRFEKDETKAAHPNTVKVVATSGSGEQSVIVGASTGGGNILITEINGIEVQLTGEYPTLIVSHRDKPGVIADVTRMLGDRSINIAFMRVFRRNRGEEAYMVIETDERVNKSVREEIVNSCDNVMRAWRI